MKRLALLIGIFCCALWLSAEPIGKNAALYTAKSYMLAKGKTVNQAQKPFKASSEGTSTEGQQDAYYYVFNAGNDGGYVIVSGDDRIEPILGYVDQGSFDPDNIPENMRSWLQLYADQIKYVVENDIQPEDPILRRRNRAQGTKHSVPELMMSRWNQGHPYNLTCPDYYTNKDNVVHHYPAAGCAATAMAQVINYYKYPDKLKAQIPAHSKTYTLKDGSEKTVSVPAVPKGTIIDWENMRDTYSCNDDHVHDAPDTAVANLMLYCGQALKMGWGASSGADTSKSRDALVNYFGFDARAFWASRPNYSIDEWFDMLYNEMEAGFPVLYRGHSSGGGHAFVIDGFDGDNLFHVNWGWGGGSNGWFLISILNPGDTSGMGASSSSDGYSMTQGGVFNLRVAGTPKTDLHLDITNISINSTRVSATFTNNTGSTSSFHVGIVEMNDDGTLTLVGSKQIITNLETGKSSSKNFAVANRLPEGVHKLSPASKSSKSDVWIPKYSTRGQYIEAIVDSLGGLDLHFKNPTKENICIDTIVFPGTRIAGNEQEVKVTFRNDGAEYFKTIYLFASKTNTKVYTESKSMVAVRSGEKVDVSYYFTPDTIPGTYNLWFCTDDKGSNVMGVGTMESVSAKDAITSNLSVSSYTIDNAVSDVVYGKRLLGRANIKNNKSEDFHGNIKIQMWRQKVGSNSATSSSSRSYSVDIPANGTTNVEFDFDNLSEGYYYRFKVTSNTQDGTLANGGLWEHRWEMKAGILLWKSDGTPSGKAYASSFSAGNTCVGLFADCASRISRLTPNRTNSNAIYALAAGMPEPKGIDGYNVVYGNHAERINLINDKPYYIPISFNADSASFTYTFPETEDGTKWHAITMPFKADSIFLDDEEVTLNDTLNHFWIYEFSAEGNDKLFFKPATTLLAGAPYIIAADATMAGKSLVFQATNVPFYKTGTDKMLVTSPNFKFHGNTHSPKLKNIYVLNEEGTAFEYSTALKALNAMSSYFTTTLPDSLAPASIVLPDIPVPVLKEATLDELALSTETPIVADTYDKLTLKRTFDAGLNTICIPFAIENVAEVFGEGAQAYEFHSFDCNDLNFIKTNVLVAGQPYVINVPNAITEDIVLSGITIEEGCTAPGFIQKQDASFCGTYVPIFSTSSETDIYGLTPEGTIVKLEGANLATGAQILIKGLRAYFDLPTSDAVTLCLYDDVTGISLPSVFSVTSENVYNLTGQRLSKMQKGINIVNSRKVLKK